MRDNRRKVRYTEQADGCIVVVSHKLNKDGYARLSCRNGYERLSMYHRHVWTEMFGFIPEGTEVDHMCRNRACCNPAHLRLLERSEHKSVGNALRYKHIEEAAYRVWEDDKSISGTALGKMFGRSFSRGYAWIRKWNKGDKR